MLKLYEGEEDEPEIVRLRLRKASVGDRIILVAVDENGDTLHAGHILGISSQGIYRKPGYTGGGIKTDDIGRVKLNE